MDREAWRAAIHGVARRGFVSPVAIRRGEGAQRKRCRDPRCSPRGNPACRGAFVPARQASLSITNSRSSLRLMSIESVIPSSHFILCHPLLLLPPIPPRIRVFSNESTLRMRWPNYWSLSFSISPSKEHPGLISFRMDWLDLLAVQGTLKSLHEMNPMPGHLFEGNPVGEGTK